MGKSSIPTLLLHGYITAGTSVTPVRDMCWDNLWPHLLQPVLEQPNEHKQKEKRRKYSGKLTGILMLTFQMGLFWVCSAPIRGSVLLHKLQHTSTTPLLRCWHTSQRGKAGLTPQINMSPCHARPCQAPARPGLFMRRVFATIVDVSAEQRRRFSRDPECQGRVNYDPHHTLNNVHRSARFLRNMREKRRRFNTEGHNKLAKKGKIDFIWNVCLF